VNFERLGLPSVTVFTAVGVSDLECARVASVQEELAAVGRSVVRSANAHEVGCRVWPAFGAQLEMMDVEISCVSAAGTWQRRSSRSMTARRKAGGVLCCARTPT